MNATILHLISLYVKFSIIFGINFVIITKIRKTMIYKNKKELIITAIESAALWPVMVVYATYYTIKDIRRK